jgi:hypothetical protein
MRVYTFQKLPYYHYKSLTLKPLIEISTKVKTGKASVRVISFIHSALFLLSRFLLIDTKRLFYLLPAKACNKVIIFQANRAKNWQPSK